MRRRAADPGGAARRLVYVVYNVDDPAVHRRVRMLRRAGVEALVVGFRRSAEPLDGIEGAPMVDLGRNANADLGIRPSRWR